MIVRFYWSTKTQNFEKNGILSFMRVFGVLTRPQSADTRIYDLRTVLSVVIGDSWWFVQVNEEIDDCKEKGQNSGQAEGLVLFHGT